MRVLRNLLRRRVNQQEAAAEIEGHLAERAAELMSAGMSEGDARAQASREFGNLALLTEESRAVWGWTRLEAMILDFRLALRGLRKNPGFALTAILTLGVGIGASTAVFTVVDSVILKPLAYEQSDRLVAVWEHAAVIGGDPVGPNPRHVDVWSQRANAFSGLTSFSQGVRGVSLGAESPRPVGLVVCQPNLFQVLRTRPGMGRDFGADDGKTGGQAVAILTHSAWQGLFRGDPGAIGRIIRVDDVPREVIGVLPEGFQFPNGNTLRSFRSVETKKGAPEPWVFVPTVFDYARMEWNGNYGNWFTLGRLADRFSMSAATAQLNSIQEQLRQEIPGGGNQKPGSLSASLQPMQEAMVGDSGQGIWLLMAAVGGLLLLACLNLANAQLGRAVSSARDAAVRAALGAAKWRLLWSVLIENIVLSGMGGALGIVLAYVGLKLFRTHSPIDLPRLAEVELNPVALLFCMAMTIAAGIVAGLLPGIRFASAAPQASLQQASTRTFGSRKSHRVRVWLIGAQVFGCTVLLLITGLFSRSLLHLLQQDKGFETRGAAIAEVRLLPKHFGDAVARIRLIDGVLAALRSSAEVASAAYFSAMPLEGESWIEFARRPERQGENAPMVNARWVSPGYFETTRQKLIAGRFFEERDRDLSNIIVSEGEARALWGAENPIGGRINALGKTFTVIGVVGDSRSTSVKTAPARMIYVHYGYRTPGQTFFIARGTHGAETLPALMRQVISAQSPHVFVARTKTLDAQLNDSLARERFQTFVLIAFGASALLLAVLGIYGVLSYSVAARKQEIGLRMALGARRSSVYALTMLEAGSPVAGGLAAGLAVSFWIVRLIEKFLYGAKAVDLPVIACVVLLFAAAATAAAFFPARHAASVNPMDALRPD